MFVSLVVGVSGNRIEGTDDVSQTWTDIWNKRLEPIYSVIFSKRSSRFFIATKCYSIRDLKWTVIVREGKMSQKSDPLSSLHLSLYSSLTPSGNSINSHKFIYSYSLMLYSYINTVLSNIKLPHFLHGNLSQHLSPFFFTVYSFFSVFSSSSCETCSWRT